MQRDLTNIKRNLEDHKNNDIIRKKAILEQAFKEDPDIIEILGAKPKQPNIKFADPENPTQEELDKRREIEFYNEKVSHEQIIPFLKLNGLQTEVLNFLMFDIEDREVGYNQALKTQYVIVMCLVHEDDTETVYGITRQDLLSYLVKDILCWSNVLGKRLKCINDYPDIIDQRYYCRTLKFEVQEPNNQSYMGPNNRYDRFTRV